MRPPPILLTPCLALNKILLELLPPASHELDGSNDAAWLEVEVVEPVTDVMGLEVVCPPVVAPGQFFVCTADIPRGSDLHFMMEMVIMLAVMWLPLFPRQTTLTTPK